MSNSLSHCLPFPVKHARFTLPLSFRVSAGTLTDPTTPDTEFSSDGGATFADCAEEITTGGTNGEGYLTLSGAETNNNSVWIAAKSANCLTTPAIVFPRVLPILSNGTASAGGATSITLGTILAYDITGAVIRTTGGTGGGGTGGANNQARIVAAYNTTTGATTVEPAWETNPDATTTYDVLLTDLMGNSAITRGLKPATDGRTLVIDANGLGDANMVKAGPSGSGTSQTARDIGASVLLSSGTGAGQILLSSGKVVTPDDQKVDIETIKTNAVVNAGTLTFPANSTLASSAEVTSIQNNTRTVIVVPAVIERPDTGTDTYLIHIYLYDEVGNMEAPDSAPTVALVNSAGTDRSSRLGSPTGTLVNTGHYKWVYTNTSSDTLEQLLWEFSVIEGGLTRLFGRDTLLVDTTAVDFTSSDRTVLNATATAVALAAAKADTAAILIDTAELQADLTNGGRLDLLIDAILADTDSLDTTKITTARAAILTDWIDGGRLDLILDIIAADTTTDIPTTLATLATAANLALAKVDTAAIKVVTDKLATSIVVDGAVYQFTANALELGPGGGGGGTGARSVTITVNDGATALQSATVRMSQGAESYAVLTNVSGVAVFALDDATWTVTVTKAGYTFTPATILVNGTETATYSMTLVTITPSDPGETTGYVTIRTLAGVEVSGAVVDVEVTRWANGTTGSGITPRQRSRTTDVNGYAEFTGLPRLATYRVRVDDGEWTSAAVTLDAATTPLTAPIGPAE